MKRVPQGPKNKTRTKTKAMSTKTDSTAAQARWGGKDRKPDQGQVRKSFVVKLSLAFSPLI